MNTAVLAFMIEKKSAVDNMEEILSIKGVDMVQFGPNDYSVSIGKAGEGKIPEVQTIQQELIKMALQKGVAPRVEINNPEDAKPYIELGVRHFNMSSDISTITNFCKRQGPILRNMVP